MYSLIWLQVRSDLNPTWIQLISYFISDLDKSDLKSDLNLIRFWLEAKFSLYLVFLWCTFQQWTYRETMDLVYFCCIWDLVFFTSLDFVHFIQDGKIWFISDFSKPSLSKHNCCFHENEQFLRSKFAWGNEFVLKDQKEFLCYWNQCKEGYSIYCKQRGKRVTPFTG